MGHLTGAVLRGVSETSRPALPERGVRPAEGLLTLLTGFRVCQGYGAHFPTGQMSHSSFCHGQVVIPAGRR